MRTLRYLVLALLFLLLVAVVVGFFLPAKVHLQRSIVIPREASKIFSVINSLQNFNQWSPWYALDVEAKYTVRGPDSGVGSKLSWQGNDKVGEGSNEIIESLKNQSIKTIFYFGKSDHPAYSTLSLKPQEQGTEVTWAFENDFGYNIFYRYFGLVLEDMIAPDYEKGLVLLKKYVESLPLYDYSSISTVQTEEQKIYTVDAQSQLNQAEITAKITEAYGKIITFIAKNGIATAGTPKIINLDHGSDTFKFRAAIPVAATDVVDENNEIMANVLYAGKALKLIHQGPYVDFKKSYDILNAYIAQNKLQRNGYSWEDFVTDPGVVSEKDLITHIYQPIK